MLPSSALKRFVERLLRRSHLSPEEQSAILGLTTRQSETRAHRDILLPGHRIDHVFLVADGFVGHIDQLPSGERQIIAIYLPGDVCDLNSIVAPRPSGGLQALTTATVVHIPRYELRSLAAAYPRIAIAFWRDTAADAAILAKQVASIGLKDARAKLAHLFCEIGLRMEEAGLAPRTEYGFPITQNQLAEATGLTPVHVNRTLQGMKTEGVVQIRHRTIQIPDWDRLARMGGFSPSCLLVDRDSDFYADITVAEGDRDSQGGPAGPSAFRPES